MTLYRLVGLDELRDAVRDRYLDTEDFDEQEVTIGDRSGLLVVGKTPKKDVGWGPTLTKLSGTSVKLSNSIASAVLLIPDSRDADDTGKEVDSAQPVDGTPGDGAEDPESPISDSDKSTESTSDATWALTFGQGFQMIDQLYIDSGFGQRVAIRSANPLGLNSISKTTLDERPRVERSTIAAGGPLRSFGFEDLGDLATRLVADGQIKGIGDKGKSVKLRGADALSLPLSINPATILKNFDSINEALSMKPATDELAMLEQLALVKDADQIRSLNEKLISAISDEDNDLLAISYPHELVDEYGRAQAYKLLGTWERTIRDDLPTLDAILKPVRNSPKAMQLEKLDKIAVVLFESTESKEPSSPRIPVKKWLAFQTDIDNQRFFLHNGRWFLMDRKYSEVVKRRTKEIFDRGPFLENLPPWEITKDPGLTEKERSAENSELIYNKMLAKQLGGICLDRNLVRSDMHKRGIEACDVLLKNGVFIHVKHVNSSAPASHLLAQAIVSTEVLTYDTTAQEDLRAKLIKLNANPDEYKLKPSRVVIVMAREDNLLQADSLFTFTQVNLARQVAQLEQQQVDVHIAPIIRQARVEPSGGA